MSFGRSCSRCKVYFVTNLEEEHMCPWCRKIEQGVEDAAVQEETDEF
jgi:RNA polymerase subunit RPABC4/transcription elongation factor Spt4